MPPPYAGILHLDIRPENILLVSPDPDSDIKVADFGFARRQKDCQPDVRYGTPAYMAPEVVKEGRYSHQAEMYSVGAVLYKYALWRPPCQASQSG